MIEKTSKKLTFKEITPRCALRQALTEKTDLCNQHQNYHLCLDDVTLITYLEIGMLEVAVQVNSNSSNLIRLRTRDQNHHQY